MANKKQGKVKAIPVKEITEGMQVLKQGIRVCKLYGIAKSRGIDYYWLKHTNADGSIEDFKFCTLVDLKTLVVEYEEKVIGAELVDYDGRFTGEYRTSFNTKQLPLKYSQWQSAINNGEVDSDKVVEFEIIDPLMKAHLKNQAYAKIIPQKKKMYTEEEMKLAFETGRNYQLTGENSFNELIDSLK